MSFIEELALRIRNFLGAKELMSSDKLNDQVVFEYQDPSYRRVRVTVELLKD